MAEMKTLNGYEVVDAAARAEIELLKAKEPDLTGYATETYVDAAIANIDFPKASGMELVEVTTNNTAEEIQAILDAGKCPIFEGVMAYQGASTPYFDGQPGEKFHLFAGVTLMTTYPNDGNLYPTLRVAKCYPGRTGSQWSETATPTSPTGYRLVTIVEFNELKNRVAALEGGNK